GGGRVINLLSADARCVVRDRSFFFRRRPAMWLAFTLLSWACALPLLLWRPLRLRYSHLGSCRSLLLAAGLLSTIWLFSAIGLLCWRLLAGLLLRRIALCCGCSGSGQSKCCDDENAPHPHVFGSP